MKSLFLSLFLVSTMAYAEKDDRYIVDPGVKIERGYASGQRQVSYDIHHHHTDLEFKSKRCYANKVIKYGTEISGLLKKGYEFTSTDIYENIIPGTNKKSATFILTFVMDFLDEDAWMAMETQPEDRDTSGPRMRPADFLEHKFLHFECELKGTANINDSARDKIKKVPFDVDTSGSQGSKGKSK